MKTIKVTRFTYYSKIGKEIARDVVMDLSEIFPKTIQSCIAIGENEFMVVITTGKEEKYYSNININKIINLLKQKIKVGRGQKIEKLNFIQNLSNEEIGILDIRFSIAKPILYGQGISVQFKKGTRTKDKIKSLEIIHRKIEKIIYTDLQRGKITVHLRKILDSESKRNLRINILHSHRFLGLGLGKFRGMFSLLAMEAQLLLNELKKMELKVPEPKEQSEE